jgi:fermentation-respiration switch protein FrsA (DUF1100 family)
MDSRPRYVAKRGRPQSGRTLFALAGVFAAAVAAANTLFTLDYGATAGRPSATVASSHAPGQFRRSRPEPPTAGQIGSYLVSSQSMRLVSRRRGQSSTRVLPTLVLYPAKPAPAVAAEKLTAGPFPLVVFAVGDLRCRSSYAALLHAWASAGYVVAAVRSPHARCGADDPREADLSIQPADISAAITDLLTVSNRSQGVLSGLIDPARIAVAGHARGGDAAAAVAADTCCRNRLVIAAVILSGAEWGPFGGRYFPPGAPPMLVVQGSADRRNPPSSAAALYLADTTGIRYYLDLLGAGHFAPYEGHAGPEPIVARVTVDFLDRYLAGEPASLTADGNVPGAALLVSPGHPRGPPGS